MLHSALRTPHSALASSWSARRSPPTSAPRPASCATWACRTSCLSPPLPTPTTATPGKTFTTEWGFGQVLPLKKNFSQLLQLGAIGYDQWQVGADGGFAAPGIPARAIPYYSVHSAGFQANYIVPPRAIQLFFKYEDEYRALSRPEGRTIVFGGTWTLRIPKPAQQQQP